VSSNIFSDGDDSKPVKLRILDTDVQIACRPSEERNASSSIEKIAIVTAINTANALLQSRSNQYDDESMTDQIASINANLRELLQE